MNMIIIHKDYYSLLIIIHKDTVVNLRILHVLSLLKVKIPSTEPISDKIKQIGPPSVD